MQLIMNDWFKAARQKLCEHSDKYTFIRNGKTFSGTRCAPFNNPNTQKQQAVRATFKAAVAARGVILEDDSLKADWEKRYTKAKRAGQTSANSLNGYLIREYFNGHVSDEGAYVENARSAHSDTD